MASEQRRQQAERSLSPRLAHTSGDEDSHPLTSSPASPIVKIFFSDKKGFFLTFFLSQVPFSPPPQYPTLTGTLGLRRSAEHDTAWLDFCWDLGWVLVVGFWIGF